MTFRARPSPITTASQSSDSRRDPNERKQDDGRVGKAEGGRQSEKPPRALGGPASGVTAGATDVKAQATGHDAHAQEPGEEPSNAAHRAFRKSSPADKSPRALLMESGS